MSRLLSTYQRQFSLYILFKSLFITVLICFQLILLKDKYLCILLIGSKKKRKKSIKGFPLVTKGKP